MHAGRSHLEPILVAGRCCCSLTSLKKNWGTSAGPPLLKREKETYLGYPTKGVYKAGVGANCLRFALGGLHDHQERNISKFMYPHLY